MSVKCEYCKEELHQSGCPNNNAVASDTRRLQKLGSEPQKNPELEKLEKLINHLVGQTIKILKVDPKTKDKCVDPVMIRCVLDEMIDSALKNQKTE